MRTHYYLFMRFDEGTILSIYPDLFTLAVARNCLAFVRRTFVVRVYIYVYLLRRSFVSTTFSPENSPERTSRHLARAPLGVVGDSLHEGRDARRAPSIEFVRNRIAPSNGARKIEHIVTAILGRLLTILLYKLLVQTWTCK